MGAPWAVDLGLETTSSVDISSGREWLVTNGLGGFASGTVAGLLTRRYHGLLIAALRPPLGRTLLVSKVDEIVRYDGRSYELGANRWADGSTSPTGFRLLQRFHLTGTVPVWTFACADALIEKRVWMQDGANTTFVRYELARGSAGPAEIDVKVLVNYRAFDGLTHADNWRMQIEPVEQGLSVTARDGAERFYLLSGNAKAEPRHEWYCNFDLAAERCRGFADSEDHLLAAIFHARLAPGEPVTIVMSSDPAALLDGGAAMAARAALDEKLLECWVAAQPEAALEAPPWVRQLALGASQFPVRRALADAEGASPIGYSILAGYPWFTDWGRDAMIALPGLTLETGRPDVARSILKTFARFVDGGMLPNAFPESNQPLGYNTVDAALWYFEAARQYYDATSDLTFIGEIFPTLVAIVEAYKGGTRYGIGMDPADALLHAGEPGSQLTWMDVKIGDHAITPRIGKPVEVNALWYNALRTTARLAFALSKPTEDLAQLAVRTATGFARFWNAERDCCFDVIDGPDGDDASIRPNQIFAVSLPESPLDGARRRSVVDVCARRLLTPHGLRTLDPDDPRYRGRYEGGPAERDTAYHQGTAWAWLLGPFAIAHLRVYRDPARTIGFLEPMAHHLLAHGVGSISEIFDGDAPFTPRGAFAQAWSVGEVLRAWRACQDALLAARSGPAAG